MISEDAVAGSPAETFEQLCRQLQPELQEFAERWVGYDDACDVVQEALIDACQRWDQLDASQRTELYLFRAVTSRLRNTLRDAKRYRAAIDRHMEDAARSHRPRFHGESSDLADAIDDALARLPEQRREAWSRVRIVGESYDEAARAMNLLPQSVRCYVALAQRQLRNRLTLKGYAPPRRLVEDSTREAAA